MKPEEKKQQKEKIKKVIELDEKDGLYEPEETILIPIKWIDDCPSQDKDDYFALINNSVKTVVRHIYDNGNIILDQIDYVEYKENEVIWYKPISKKEYDRQIVLDFEIWRRRYQTGLDYVLTPEDIIEIYINHIKDQLK